MRADRYRCRLRGRLRRQRRVRGSQHAFSSSRPRRSTVPVFGFRLVGFYPTPHLIKVSEIVRGVWVAALRRTKVPLKGFSWVGPNAFAPAEAYSHRKLRF